MLIGACSLLGLLLFLVLLTRFFGVAASEKTPPMSLNPLCTSCEQLHPLAILCLLSFYDLLNFLLLSIFLQTLLPLLLKLVKFVELVV